MRRSLLNAEVSLLTYIAQERDKRCCGLRVWPRARCSRSISAAEFSAGEAILIKYRKCIARTAEYNKAGSEPKLLLLSRGVLKLVYIERNIEK